MKKLLFIITLGLASIFLASPKVYALGNEHEQSDTEDDYLDMDFVKNGNSIEIKLSDTSYTITTAVVEQAYLSDTKKVSILKDYDVKNNAFILDNNILAFDIWQLRVTKKGKTYLYMTKGTTKYNSLSDVVERRGFTHIRTVRMKIQDTHLYINDFYSYSSNILTYFEYFFQFNKEHDQVINIDVEYNLIKGVGLGQEIVRTNERIVPDGVELEGYVDTVPSLGFMTTDKIVVRGLDNNFNTSYKANYVARVFPVSKIDSQFRMVDYSVENWAIVNIEYVHEGVFFSERVINPPTSTDDNVDYNLEWLKNLINEITSIWQKITDWLKNNLGSLYSIALIIIGLMLLGPLSAILMLIINAIKLAISLFKNIFKFITWLIIPRKKKG
ncbi:MAG: hypothetical protein RBQ97_03680 [Acholeplasma sp.]|nr:hypothetical protein [Acholeplasma sp.]